MAFLENRDVVPELHKLHTLAATYRPNLLEILGRYDTPIDEMLARDEPSRSAEALDAGKKGREY